jgi:hypothetical protein
MEYRMKNWLEAEERAKWGADMAYLLNRVEEDPTEWDETRLLQQYVPKDSLIFDMNSGKTGNLLEKDPKLVDTFGERTETDYIWHDVYFGAPLDEIPVETPEEFAPEEDEEMPGRDSVDVVLNKGIAVSPKKVFEVLKPYGVYMVELAGSKNHAVLAEKLTGKPRPDGINSLAEAVSAHEASRFTPLYQKECFTKVKFFDMEALIFYLKTMVEDFPPFSVKESEEVLANLYSEILQYGSITSTRHRMMMVFKKG